MREKKKALRSEVKKAAERAGKAAGAHVAGGASAVEDAHAGTSAEEGALAADRVEALPEFARAHTVALYRSLPDEVPTAEMLGRWSGEKCLALPVITGDGTMVFREYTGEGSLAPGSFGIDAPGSGREIPPSEIDLALVPGVAFDAAGRRLGRGGGFYDRYLSHPAAAHIYKVGLCRAGALVAEVPAEAHDVAMDCVVTF